MLIVVFTVFEGADVAEGPDVDDAKDRLASCTYCSIRRQPQDHNSMRRINEKSINTKFFNLTLCSKCMLQYEHGML